MTVLAFFLRVERYMNKKKFFFDANLFLCLSISTIFFNSCVTPRSQVMSFILSDGRLQYYVTPVAINDKEISVSIDFTIHCNNTQISDDVVMNYTVSGAVLEQKDSSDVKINFSYGDKMVSCQNVNIIYRNVNPKQIRMNSTIDKEEFKSMIYTDKPIYIVVTDGSCETKEIESKELNTKIKELCSVIY